MQPYKDTNRIPQHFKRGSVVVVGNLHVKIWEKHTLLLGYGLLKE